jgi:membrane protease YdiL (CAAX protease family)
MVMLVAQFAAGSDVISLQWIMTALVVGPLVALYFGLVRYAPTTPTGEAVGFALPTGRQLAIALLAIVAGAALAPIVADLTVREGATIPPEVAAELKTREGVIWTAALGVIAGPIAEEMLFRGFLQRHLQRTIGVGRAFVFTAVVFSMCQMDPLSMLPLLLVGLAMGTTTLVGGTTWAAVLGRLAHEGAPYVFDWAGFKIPDPDSNPNPLDAQTLVICGAIALAAIGGMILLRARRR